MFTSQNNKEKHLFFMRLALAQAHKNLGNTKENPSVGCVITKNNTLISAGCTSISGRPHAEHNAIITSNSVLNGSTMYVTLEPCSRYGLTPPCTKKIIISRLKKVFFPIDDPDNLSSNNSLNLFKKKNIKAIRGLYKKEAISFYRSYIKSKNDLFPFITCKLAVSKDYYTVNKKKKWITNHYSRGRVHLIRSYHDCILTTVKTIISDNSNLTCRIKGLNNKSPVRVILDKKFRIPLKSKILTNAKNVRTIILFNKFNSKKAKILKKLNIELYKIDTDYENNLDLKQVLIKLKELGYYRILVESGFKLMSNFFRKNLVDDFVLFKSNININKNGKYNVKKQLKFFLRNRKGYKSKVNLFGEKITTYNIN